jgi:selenide,water dikinase
MKLTQTVKKGGCAAKVPAMILREILAGVKFPPKIEGLKVDGAHFDDAAIYEINDEVSLVQTLDFFTPIVDDPGDFGAIAAVNSLSDVYAMGGLPKTCMAILAAPLATMEPVIIQQVLQGAADKIKEAGASLVGGHSIDDDTLKFGLSVTGLVKTGKVWTNENAKVGDVLLLTKPLGTGTICAGIKRGEVSENEAEEALSSMKRLNNVMAFLSSDLAEAIHAATDITGFGLAGHSYQMARASQVSFIFESAKLPLFKLTRSSLEKGWLTKAHRSNAEYTAGKISFKHDDEIMKNICFDPQTSGGLLLSVEAEKAPAIWREILNQFPGTAIIGRVTKKSEFDVTVE